MRPTVARRPRCSYHLQPLHRARAAAEGVNLQPQTLEHRDEEVRQRVVVVQVEGQMLAVLKAAAGQNDRHVSVVVAVTGTAFIPVS